MTQQSLPSQDHSFFGHPRGLATLFSTELWERFSFYGMRALLTLFLATSVQNGGLGLGEGLASSIYAVYGAAVYLVALPGGWLADRVLGPRRSVMIGAFVIMLGHVSMALPLTPTIWLGLLLIIAGTALLKPNISAIVGVLYGEQDARRDAGFSIFYMGINLGAFISPLICGYLGQQVSWHLGFGAAAVGMFAGLMGYLYGQRHLGDVGLRPAQPLTPSEARHITRRALLAVVVVAALALVAWALGRLNLGLVVNAMTVLAFLVTVVYFWRVLTAPDLRPEDRDRMRSFIWLFVAAALFWLIYDQGGSVLTLFAQQNTERSAFGFAIPASWLNSLNPIMIIALAPVFAVLWARLGKRNPPTPVKFAFGLAGVGLSFVVVSVAAAGVADGGKASVWWLVLVYLIQTVAELTLSPIGLSVSTKLAPPNLTGQVLGLWFLATAVGDATGAQVVKLIERLPQSTYFLSLGVTAIVVAAVLLAGARRVRRLMHGVN